MKSEFTGILHFVQPIKPGEEKDWGNIKIPITNEIAEWYDEALNPSITGKSIWLANKLLNPDDAGKIWYCTEIFVDNTVCKS